MKRLLLIVFLATSISSFGQDRLFTVGLAVNDVSDSLTGDAKIVARDCWYSTNTITKVIIPGQLKFRVIYNPRIQEYYVRYVDMSQNKCRIVRYMVNYGELTSMRVRAKSLSRQDIELYGVTACKLKFRLNRFQGEYMGRIRWTDDSKETVEVISLNLQLPLMSELFELEKTGFSLIYPYIREVNAP